MASKLVSFYRNLEMLPLRKRIVLYVGASFVAVFIGFIVGFALLPSQSNGAETVPNGTVNGNETESEDGEFDHTGYIQENESSVYEEGTHELYDSEGNLVAVLINNKRLLDLNFFRNRLVEIVGIIEDTVEGEPPLVRVRTITVR